MPAGISVAQAKPAWQAHRGLRQSEEVQKDGGVGPSKGQQEEVARGVEFGLRNS